MRRFVVGTRGSALALWQTRHVSERLTAARPTASIAERIITTQGDVNLTAKLVGTLEKGFFTQELEAALHAKEIDWAVHSLKDLPTRMPEGLCLGAVLPRASAADLLISLPSRLDETKPLGLAEGTLVGTCSLRREAMLTHYAPHLRSSALRGNVPTRVQKLRDGQYGAIVLAEAGVSRLELSLAGLHVQRLNPRRWPCAPGQGAVAVQCRVDDAEVRDALASIHDATTARATELERSLLRVLEGGCTTPFGCYVEGTRLSMGLLRDGQWLASELELPALTDEAWVRGTLDAFPPTMETTHEWLTRRL